MDMNEQLPDNPPEGHDDRPEPEPCKKCDKLLQPVQSITGGWYRPPDRCDRCEREHLIKEHRKRQMNAGKRAVWKRAGIPQSINAEMSINFEWPGGCKESLEMMLRIPPTGAACWPSGVYLGGRTGGGKTLWACKILKAYLQHWRVEADERRLEYGSEYDPAWERCTARFFDANNTLQAKKESFDSGDPVDLREYHNADFLVIDDLGRETISTWTSNQIMALINARVKSRKPTVFTSEASPRDLPDWNRKANQKTSAKPSNYDEAMISRIIQICTDPATEEGEESRLYEVKFKKNHRLEGL